jgi:hypothetical protein
VLRLRAEVEMAGAELAQLLVNRRDMPQVTDRQLECGDEMLRQCCDVSGKQRTKARVA